MSATAVTEIVVAPVAVSVPPMPAVPLSLIFALSVIGPLTDVLKSAAGTYCSAPAAIALLMAVTCPSSFMFVPVTVALMDGVVVQLNVPLPAGRSRVTVTDVPCAFDSTSVIVIPVIVKAVSSVAANGPAGTTIVGASLTATTVTVEVIASAVVSTPPEAVPPLSFTCVSVTTRLPAVGLSRLVS